LPFQIFILIKKGNTILWAIIACLFWSTAYAGIKIGLQYDKPFHFAGLRFIIAGLIIFPFAGPVSDFFRTLRENFKVIMLVIFLQMIVNYSLFYSGMRLVPGALGAVIVGSQPLITALVASMMHDEDKLTGRKIVTIITGMSGVILISAGRQAFRFGTAMELLGVAMILTANASLSVANVIVSLKTSGINPFVLSSVSLLTGGLVLYLISVISGEVPSKPFPEEYWIVLLWLSLMAATAFSIWYTLLKRPGVKVSELNLWKFIIPVAGAVLSWLFVPGEKPEWVTASGMIIITGSLVMFFTNRKEPHSL
jgi:drug/metabolite transporter (DMT)-like permease